jgi:DNA polymerase-3 subunit delta'
LALRPAKRLSKLSIRSRTLPVRFAPLPERAVAQILEARGLDASVAAFSQGSASLALLLADPERQADREQFVASVLQALDAPDLVSGLKLRL